LAEVPLFSRVSLFDKYLLKLITYHVFARGFKSKQVLCPQGANILAREMEKRNK
jgi:hypothetical protein